MKDDTINALTVLLLTMGCFVTIMLKAAFRTEHTKNHNPAKITKPTHKCTSEIKASQKNDTRLRENGGVNWSQEFNS